MLVYVCQCCRTSQTQLTTEVAALDATIAQLEASTTSEAEEADILHERTLAASSTSVHFSHAVKLEDLAAKVCTFCPCQALV